MIDKLFTKLFNRHVLPLPTFPMTAICSPFLIFKFISFNNLISISSLFSSSNNFSSFSSSFIFLFSSFEIIFFFSLLFIDLKTPKFTSSISIDKSL